MLYCRHACTRTKEFTLIAYHYDVVIGQCALNVRLSGTILSVASLLQYCWCKLDWLCYVSFIFSFLNFYFIFGIFIYYFILYAV